MYIHVLCFLSSINEFSEKRFNLYSCFGIILWEYSFYLYIFMYQYPTSNIGHIFHLLQEFRDLNFRGKSTKKFEKKYFFLHIFFHLIQKEKNVEITEY